jgi:hypothetical protein
VIIYVAARASDAARVRLLYELLTAAGHVITHRWADLPILVDGNEVDEGAIDPADAVRIASDDLTGALTAELVLLLADRGPNYCGALIETGAALAAGRRVWVVDPWRPSVFWHLPDVRVVTFEQALTDLGAAVPVP